MGTTPGGGGGAGVGGAVSPVVHSPAAFCGGGGGGLGHFTQQDVSWNGGGNGGGGSPAAWPTYDLNMSSYGGGGGFTTAGGGYSYMLGGGVVTGHDGQLFGRPHEYSSPLGDQSSPLGRAEYSLLQTHSPTDGSGQQQDDHSLTKIEYGQVDQDDLKQDQQPPPTYVTLPPFLN